MLSGARICTGCATCLFSLFDGLLTGASEMRAAASTKFILSSSPCGHLRVPIRTLNRSALACARAKAQNRDAISRRFPSDKRVTMSRAMSRLLFVVAFLYGARALPAQTFPTDHPILKRIWAIGMDSSRTWDLAQVLSDSIGPRLTGSPGQKAGNNWLLKTYREWGVDAKNEQYGTWRGWRRGYTHVDLIQPRERTLEALMLPWSPTTQGRAVIGPTVLIPIVKDSTEFLRWLPNVRGKFVLMSAPKASCRPNSQWTETGLPGALERLQATNAQLASDFAARLNSTQLNTGGRGAGGGRGGAPADSAARAGGAGAPANTSRAAARRDQRAPQQGALARHHHNQRRRWLGHVHGRADAEQNRSCHHDGLRGLRSAVPVDGAQRGTRRSREHQWRSARRGAGVQHDRNGERHREAGRVRHALVAFRYVGRCIRHDRQRHRHGRRDGSDAHSPESLSQPEAYARVRALER